MKNYYIMKKEMGLIGGVEPEATIPYYHGIIYGVQKKLLIQLVSIAETPRIA